MDYSSNVALCLNRAAAGSLTRKLSHLSKEKEENVQILALFNSAECYKAKDGAEVFLWNDISWSLDKPEIEYVEYFLDSLEMGAFRFLRIGEETDDIEASGDYRDNPFRLDVKRSLSFRKPRHHAGK